MSKKEATRLADALDAAAKCEGSYGDWAIAFQNASVKLRQWPEGEPVMMEMIDDYATAVHDGDDAACVVLRRTIQASLGQFPAATTPPDSAARIAALDGSEAVWAIIFDDYDRRPETWISEKAARARFEAISGSWNAHLFVKIASNSRDDPRAGNNAVLASARIAELEKQRDALLEALKYHMEQTRPIQRSIDAIEAAGGGKCSD